MSYKQLLPPALLVSLGAFVVAVAFLPRTSGMITWSSRIEYFFVSREHWEIPFLVAIGTFLFVLGVAGLMRRSGDGNGV